MRRSLLGKFIHSLTAVLALALYACSGSRGPENLEPELRLLEAEDITRTEATLKAVVERHGLSTLSYVRFVYSRDGEPRVESDNLVPDEEGLVCLRLTGLRPGCTYAYYAVGGTSTATIQTQPLNFVTQPNDKPKVGAAVPLSTGPLSIIVEFEVIDDGGEPLTSAGCYLKEVATGSELRLSLDQEELTKGKHRLCITPMKVKHEYEITPFAANTAGETTGETLSYTTRNSVVLADAGGFRMLFEGASGSIDTVTVSGPMNGDDFHFLRLMLGAQPLPGEDMPRAKTSCVDLSDAVITEGGQAYDGQRFIEANVVSTGLFARCPDLVGITLPSTAVSMRRNALLDCTRLSSLTIPAGVEEVVPSTGCTALKSIKVSDANTAYRSHEGVLYTCDFSEMVWFPEAKTDAFTLPPAITEIGVGAFKNIPVRSLIIPETVKTIARGAFSGSEIEEIALPDGLKNVSEAMFQECRSLTVLRLGKGVDFMGNYALDGCPLEHIYITAVIPPYVSEKAFASGSWDLLNKCTLHVPAESRSRYRNHAKWGKFIKIVAND